MTDINTVEPDDDGDYFDLNAAAAEQRSKRKPFKFIYGPDNRKWRMQNLYILPLSLLEEAQEGQVDALRQALTIGLGAQASDFGIGDMDLTALVLLFEKWSAAAGATAGESEASSDSSASTERPSKPTSTVSTESDWQKPSSEPSSSATHPGSF